jgi:hypothetical protein
VRCATTASPIPPPAGRVTWEGVDILPITNGLITRKDVYSDRLAVLRQTAPPLEDDRSSWRERKV